MKAANARRVRVYGFSYESLEALFTGKLQVMSNQFPKGAKILSIHPNYLCQSLDFVVQHRSFESVSPGAMMPRFSGIVYEPNSRCRKPRKSRQRQPDCGSGDWGGNHVRCEADEEVRSK